MRDRTTAIWGLFGLLAAFAGLAGVVGAMGEPGDSVREAGGPAVLVQHHSSVEARRPAPLPAPDRPDPVEIPRPAPGAARNAGPDGAIELAMMRAKCSGLAAENEQLRAEVEALRGRLEQARARASRDLSTQVSRWLEQGFVPADFSLPTSEGVLDLRPDVHAILMSAAASLETDEIEVLQRRVDRGHVHGVTRQLALWYEASLASGRQDWDDRRLRVQAALGLRLGDS